MTGEIPQKAIAFTIPIRSAKGSVQNRLFLTRKAPTKENLIKSLMSYHESSTVKDDYTGEWERAADVVRLVPEDFFAHLRSGKTNHFSHYVVVAGIDTKRLFLARQCVVNELEDLSE